MNITKIPAVLHHILTLIENIPIIIVVPKQAGAESLVKGEVSADWGVAEREEMMVRRTASLEDQFLFLPRTFHSAEAERSNRGEGGWIL